MCLSYVIWRVTYLTNKNKIKMQLLLKYINYNIFYLKISIAVVTYNTLVVTYINLMFITLYFNKYGTWFYATICYK